MQYRPNPQPLPYKGRGVRFKASLLKGERFGERSNCIASKREPLYYPIQTFRVTALHLNSLLFFCVLMRFVKKGEPQRFAPTHIVLWCCSIKTQILNLRFLLTNLFQPESFKLLLRRSRRVTNYSVFLSEKFCLGNSYLSKRLLNFALR